MIKLTQEEKKEHAKTARQKWLNKHPEKLKEYKERHRLNHKLHYAEYHREYRMLHPEKAKIAQISFKGKMKAMKMYSNMEATI